MVIRIYDKRFLHEKSGASMILSVALVYCGSPPFSASCRHKGQSKTSPRLCQQCASSHWLTKKSSLCCMCSESWSCLRGKVCSSCSLRTSLCCSTESKRSPPRASLLLRLAPYCLAVLETLSTLFDSNASVVNPSYPLFLSHQCHPHRHSPQVTFHLPSLHLSPSHPPSLLLLFT